MKVVGLISGGKDSIYNLVNCAALGHEIIALANLRPPVVDEMDSFMFQTVGHEVVLRLPVSTVLHFSKCLYMENRFHHSAYCFSCSRYREAIDLIADAMSLPLIRRNINGGSIRVEMDYCETPGQNKRSVIIDLREHLPAASMISCTEKGY